jgi:hypothetical protein
LQSRGSLKLLERAAVGKLNSASNWHWQSSTLPYVVASVEVSVSYVCSNIFCLKTLHSVSETYF